MSNPTLIAENFSDSLGDFTGVDPIRYDSGLWLEEATTNLHPNPVANSATTNYLSSGATISRDTGTWVFGPASVKVVTNGSVQDERVRPHTNLLGYTGSARTFIGSVYTHVPLGATMRLQLLYLYSDATTDAVQTNFTGTGEWERIESPPLASNAAKTLNYMYAEVATRLTAQAITYYVNAVQIEEKAYATSFAHGGLGDGYAFTGTAHASPSTRAASSASVTIAEPVSVACWYTETYGGTKTFEYLSTLGALGTYGDVSYAAGDLTISTTRNLVIGPFAAFDRELTAAEQGVLAGTQDWSLSLLEPEPEPVLWTPSSGGMSYATSKRRKQSPTKRQILSVMKPDDDRVRR